MPLNNEQQRVYAWLKDDLNLPVFAAAYKGAVIFLSQKPPGYISFVAHASRDMMNGLAGTFAGIERTQVQYKQRLDELQKNWRNEWKVNDDPSIKESKEAYLIPIKICQMISNLIEEHLAGRQRNSDMDVLFFSTFLEYADREKIPKNFLSEWRKTRSWFMARTHLRKDSFRENDNVDLAMHFNCLDKYLYIAASSQYERLKALNEILDATNQ